MESQIETALSSLKFKEVEFNIPEYIENPSDISIES
jgi:hypothetical protein